MIVPARREDVQVREVAGELLVLDRRSGLIHQFNETASYVWERCDGATSSEEIIAAMAADYGLNEANVRQDVLTMIGKLEELGLLQVTDVETTANEGVRT